MTVTSETKSTSQASETLAAYVMAQMKAGMDKQAIIQQVINKGVDKSEAAYYVEKIYDQTLKASQAEQVTTASLMPAVLGGAIAAIVGGVLWGLIVILTNYEIGYMALGVGFLCGYGVVIFSKGRRGTPMQMIAIVFSLVGILIGKYVTFFHFYKQAVAEGYGSEAASGVSLFSGDMLSTFMQAFGSLVSGFDLLWVALAVFTAWRIPKGLGLKVKK